MRVSVIVISYNTRELTMDCLRSVCAEMRTMRGEIIVFDNASTDGSAEAIAAEFSAVTLLPSACNVGFARANNLAARHATGEFLLLLNPDTVVLEGAISTLVSFARRRTDGGVFGGRTLYGDGTLNETSCFDLPTPWSLFCAAIGLSSVFPRRRLFNGDLIGGWARDSVRAVGVVTGCFLLVRRSLWDRLGGFDESFFMYSEDTDLCCRAWKTGHACLHCPDATIIHYGGRSEVCRANKMVKVLGAKKKFLQKHWSPTRAAFGVLMLELYVLNRLIAQALLRFISARNKAAYGQWREVWLRRHEWRSASRQESRAALAGPDADAARAAAIGRGC
jgi:hypothetical protein